MEKPVGKQLLGGPGRKKDSIEIARGIGFIISGVECHRVVN
jgi:hypothetical protein